MSVDFLANITVFCCMAVLLIVYSCVALLPPWDDGTGLHFNFHAHPDVNEQLRVDLPSKHARRWSNVHLRFEWDADKKIASVLDDSQQLGRYDVVRLHFCDGPNSTLCPCDRMKLLGEKAERTLCHKKVSDIEKSLRKMAATEAEYMERGTFDHVVSKLIHYYQTNAGIDVLFTTLWKHQEVDVEKAIIKTRHTRWLAFQPRMPPLPAKFLRPPEPQEKEGESYEETYMRVTQQTQKKEKKSKPPSPDSFLRFTLADKDERWVHELSMDPQANALKHAPFVFPVSLIMLTCVWRLVVGSLTVLKNLVMKKKKKKKE